jgi:hypothetical protein
VKLATKIGIAVTGAAAATTAAILRRGVRGNKEPHAKDPPPDPAIEPDVSGAAFLKHLSAAVRIDTTSHDDRSKIDTDRLVEFHQFLEETYPLVHENCTREIIGEYSQILAPIR